MLGDAPRLGGRKQRRDRVFELLQRGLDAVGLEDPAELLQLEPERGVGRALAVRKRAPAHDPCRRGPRRALRTRRRAASCRPRPARSPSRAAACARRRRGPTSRSAAPARARARRARRPARVLPGRALRCSAIHAGDRKLLAFRVHRRSRRRRRSPRASRDRSPRRRGCRRSGRRVCSRAAVLTTSPVTIASPSAARAFITTSASPVFTATRIFRSSCGSASSIARTRSRTASAARTARSASSPNAVGAPNSPMIASPMNFSTTPPNDSISPRTASWYGRSSAWTSSGSSRSDARREADEVDEDDADEPALLVRRLVLAGERLAAGEAEPRDRRGSPGHKRRRRSQLDPAVRGPVQAPRQGRSGTGPVRHVTTRRTPRSGSTRSGSRSGSASRSTRAARRRRAGRSGSASRRRRTACRTATAGRVRLEDDVLERDELERPVVPRLVDEDLRLVRVDRRVARRARG